MMTKLIRLKRVMELTGLSRSTIYAYIKAGKFPSQVVLTERCVGWPEDAIQNCILQRIEEGVIA
jgi:prophage regulatory protein